MFTNLLLVSIQVCVIIREARANLLQPEYSVKLFNTENIVLTLGDIDIDKNDDLELIKNSPEDQKINGKLDKFHKYVKSVEATKPPVKMFIYHPNSAGSSSQEINIYYPDSELDIAVDRKHLSKLERRKKKKWTKPIRVKKNWKLEKFIVNKRDLTPVRDVEDEEVAYFNLEKEYQDLIFKSQQNKTAFKYSDEGKPEESIRDVINKITDLKTPKNCTNVTGIGVQAVECLMKNYNDTRENRETLIYNLSIILSVWLAVYFIAVIPFWCIKGWCCCCCPCDFCDPIEIVRDIQIYIADNPPGIYLNSNGEEERYIANSREVELYDKIKRSIAEF